MKRIVFLIIATLLVLGLVLPGCGATTPKVVIAIAGPMSNVQGQHMWNGATLAEAEINALNGGQGIEIGSIYYQIDVIKINTNEISSPESAGPAMEAAITTKNAQFVVGGFRTEAVSDMINVARTTTTPFFIAGAATYYLLSGKYPLAYPHAGTPYIGQAGSDGYEYIFRATPFNDGFLLNNTMMMNVMVANRIATIIGANATNKVKFAVLSESLDWANVLTEKNRYLIGTVAGLYGLPWELATGGNNGTGVWRVTDNPSSLVMTDVLNEITTSGAHIIVTVLSGPVGVTFGKLKGSLEVPAMVVGINVEGQSPAYWANTQYAPGKYGADGEIGLGTFAPGVEQTTLTADFIARYQAHCGLFPIYTASSYDAVWTIAKALDAVNVIEEYGVAPDPKQLGVITWMENPANAQNISTGISSYYPRWDGSTNGTWSGYEWPALSTAQITATYGDASNYAASCNFSMPTYTTHDLVYGPGWVTGIGVQWVETGGGIQIGVWPENTTWTIQNTFSRAISGLNWTDLEYPGTVDFVIPQALIDAWEA